MSKLYQLIFLSLLKIEWFVIVIGAYGTKMGRKDLFFRKIARNMQVKFC